MQASEFLPVEAHSPRISFLIKNMNYLCIIFDCDGVLVDSEVIVNRIFAKMLTEVGFPITYAEMTQQFTGKSLKTCLEIIEQTYRKPLPKNFIERCKEREITALQQELQPV